MTVERYDFGGNVMTTDLALGNAMALAIGGPTWANTFGAIKLRPVGSQSTTPTAWFANLNMRQHWHDCLVEFNGAGPYPLVNGHGVDDNQVAYAKTKIVLEVGDRDAIGFNVPQFLLAQGYEVIPIF